MKNEAEILAARWGVKVRPVLAWMTARGIATAMDFRKRWPGDWQFSNEAALNDFWTWGLS